MIDKLDDLRNSISNCLAGEKAYDLPKVCQRYSLEEGEESEAFQSKYKYVITRLKDKKEYIIIDLAKELINDYQSYLIGNSLNQYLDFQYYKLTEVTRNEIIERLKSLEHISGNLDPNEFLLKAGLSNYIQTTSFDFFSLEAIEKDPIQELLDGRILYEVLDSQFFAFIEQLVHPIPRSEQEVDKYLEMINPILSKDDFELVQSSFVSGRPIYKVIQRNGVKGVVKNLIFASKDYKPEIVIEDALNNDLKIVKNEDSCLVYNRAIPNDGLKWIDLVDWWATINNSEKNAELAKGLYNRLNESLDSKPEKDFFKTYYFHYKDKLGKNLPALIPQVYLHYDPYTIRKHGIQYLLRQRMDFLMLFSNTKRVVIEIDGKQHYSIGDVASPKLYSEMVRLDRELRFLNYDVYRLGGHELSYDMKNTTISFFDSLFEKYL
jgi:hypothetical protein